MTKAQELLASPEFNSLPEDVQNRLLIAALTENASVSAPISQVQPVQALPSDAVIMHIQGQPYVLIPMESDPTAGISQPLASVMGSQAPGLLDVGKSTLGTLGDVLKQGIGLALGTVGAVGNLAVDVATLGQSKGGNPIK